MRKSVLVFILLSSCPLAFGQLNGNSITVTASNNANLQPDEVVFSVSVQSALATGLDDIVAALQGSGITAANLSGLNTTQQYVNGSPSTLALQWTFSLPVPLTNTKATIASLTTIEQTIGAQNNGLTLSFTIVGTQVSQQLAQSQTCSLSNLIASATTQAQGIATAAGVTLGRINAISSSTSNVVANPYATAPPCAITVTFSETRR
jgi:uncharacterized protein YggE